MFIFRHKPTLQVPRHSSRRYTYPLLFLCLITLAGLSNGWADGIALGQTTPPPSTIPPGGTLPPPPIPTEGTGLVRVLHLAPLDAVIANTAIDICTEAGVPVPGLTGLVYLEQSGYISLPAGSYDWTVGTPGCATEVLDLPAFTLSSGTVLTILVVGGDNQPLSSFLLVDRVDETRRYYLPFIAR